jgi:hypothetical protein
MARTFFKLGESFRLSTLRAPAPQAETVPQYHWTTVTNLLFSKRPLRRPTPSETSRRASLCPLIMEKGALVYSRGEKLSQFDLSRLPEASRTRKRNVPSNQPDFPSS